MKERKEINVIFDTNVFISFLIGKRLKGLKALLVHQSLKLILSDKLLEEIIVATQKPKLRKYFELNKVHKLIEFLKAIGKFYDAKSGTFLCRDPKDNFLLDLSLISDADYLITGDNDLLEIGVFNYTKIITFTEFEKIIE